MWFHIWPDVIANTKHWKGKKKPLFNKGFLFFMQFLFISISKRTGLEYNLRLGIVIPFIILSSINWAEETKIK